MIKWLFGDTWSPGECKLTSGCGYKLNNNLAEGFTATFTIKHKLKTKIGKDGKVKIVISPKKVYLLKQLQESEYYNSNHNYICVKAVPTKVTNEYGGNLTYSYVRSYHDDDDKEYKKSFKVFANCKGIRVESEILYMHPWADDESKIKTYATMKPEIENPIYFYSNNEVDHKKVKLPPQAIIPRDGCIFCLYIGYGDMFKEWMKKLGPVKYDLNFKDWRDSKDMVRVDKRAFVAFRKMLKNKAIKHVKFVKLATSHFTFTFRPSDDGKPVTQENVLKTMKATIDKKKSKESVINTTSSNTNSDMMIGDDSEEDEDTNAQNDPLMIEVEVKTRWVRIFKYIESNRENVQEKIWKKYPDLLQKPENIKKLLNPFTKEDLNDKPIKKKKKEIKKSTNNKKVKKITKKPKNNKTKTVKINLNDDHDDDDNKK